MPQLLTSKEETLYITASDVQPVLMISKCDQSFESFLSRYGIRELCENPGRPDSIETLLPVRNDNTNDNFKNIFCAYCNGVDILKLSFWRMDMHCHDSITFIEKYLLNTIRNKRCNVFFKPPWFETAIPCRILKYAISQCNETGLWPVYNDTINQACESFVDPFNSTYQNYFCYLCNSRQTTPRDSWFCPAPSQKSQNTGTGPVYTTALEVEIFTKQRNKELGCDLETQFLDNIKVRPDPDVIISFHDPLSWS